MIQLNSTIRNDIKAGVQNFEYLININNEVYVATRKQMLRTMPKSDLMVVGTDKVQDIYFEDAGMRITDLSEKIDLKTKKPQLGNTTITFANFSVYKGGKEKKFSDEFGKLVGKNLKIYFKTQSCKTLSECLLVAQLKITRIKHDDKKITISANDLSIDSTYKEIPDNDYVLLKDINTFDHYSLKPVPTLYGHLENAPAIVYKETQGDTYKIKLIPDTSYFDDTEIGGILPFRTDGENGIVFDDVDGEFGSTLISKNLQLVRQNVLKISLGDYLCDVPCLPYQQTREAIKDTRHEDELKLHTKAQWFSNQNHILLNFDVGEETDESLEEASLWCAINQKPLTQETLTYQIRAKNSTGTSGGYEGFYDGAYNNITMISVMDEHNPLSDDADRNVYKIGVQKFKFAPFSGYDLNDKLDEDEREVYKSDVHYIGNLKVTQFLDAPRDSHQATLIHSVFSPPIHKDGAVDVDSYQDNVGYPTSLTNEINGGTADDSNFNLTFRRATIKLQGVDDGYSEGDDLEFVNYRSSFTSSLFDERDENSFVSRYSDGAEFKYPTIDATILSLYYFVDDSTGGTPSTGPNTRVDITPEWRDLEMRKVWSNKQIFEKDFFVNAKGKLGDLEPNIKDVSGNIIVKHEGTDTPSFSHNDAWKDNLHFTEFYKLLTNSEFKTKTIDGQIYQIMLASYDQSINKYNFLFDVEIENLHFAEEDLPTGIFLDNILHPYGGTPISHRTGWILKFNGKYFGDQFNIGTSDFRRGSNGVRLVYGKKIYENTFVSDIEFVEDEVFNDFNNNNYYEFPFEGQVFSSDYELGYTSVFWESNAQQSKKLIEKPHEIIQDLLSQQDAVINFDDEKINKIYEQAPEYKLAFSINEQKNTSEIIQKICQQSLIYYRYRGRDKKIVVDFFKNKYDDSDLSGVIETQRLLNFSFDRTKIEDGCMGGVVVNYAYNYATEKFDKRTGKRDLGVFRTDYAQYYGIDDLKGYEVEIDAPYIQDKGTAEFFRDYYFELNKQQKLTCRFELPMSDGIQYEVGDIIRFDANPNRTQPYGIDLTTNNQIIDQESTPYFFITKVQKSLFRVKIECIQTHELKYDLPKVSLLGDINLDGQVTTEGDNSDLFILLDMVGQQQSDITYDELLEAGYTIEQIVNADMNQDGVINTQDIILFIEQFGGSVS